MLEDFLNSLPISNVNDPITWWSGIASGGNPLACMALDFLSAPGMFFLNFGFCSAVLLFSSAASTDVERAFSRGGLVVTKLRHNLSDESTRAATILHSWSQIPGLIPHSEIIQVFKDKSKRSKTVGDPIIIEE